MNRRVVVTGVGIVSPIGVGTEAFWHSLIAGESGIGYITRFDASAYPCQIAGEVDDAAISQFLTPQEVRRTSRFAQLALAASSLAIQDAGLSPKQLAQPTTGVIIGTSVGPMAVVEQQTLIAHERGIDRVNPFSAFMGSTHSAASYVNIKFGIPGPALTISTGCAGGVDAIGHAFNALRRDALDVAVVGASEAPICPILVSSLHVAQTLSVQNDHPTKAARPFDRGHNGFVLSEGAAMVILESLDNALARGAHIYGEICGYAASSDAYHPFAIEPEGAGFIGAMRGALADAGVGPAEIDYISAHAPSIASTDRAEAKAIRQFFGERAFRIPVSSIKASVGQALAAAGAQQLIAGLLTLEAQTVPPTANYEEPDPECDLDCVPLARPESVRTILVNAHSLGGSNSSLVLRKPLLP
jgi:3-oxoacyl-[acyl-carrier-protein] synthase II